MFARTRVGIALALVAGALAFAPAARALDDESLGFEITPPRLSFQDGAVSFMRAGADDWSPARVNTPLAAGDELFSAEHSNLELQVGPRAYVRGGEQTQLGLTSLEPDFLQFRLTSGHLSLDLRSLKAGQTIEVDTPQGAFTVERTGYYRVEVETDATRFTSRRGGQAQVTPASGATAMIAPSEQVILHGGDDAELETFAAPELDGWDRWNYARTDDQLDAVSSRYVSNEVYGADDLDQYGDWRVVPSYGTVWVPRHVAAGWAPYSTGVWLHDPYYGWSWVDDAPWGWAPYHYGRWVNVSGFWGWYPGPIVARAYYAPALVAFYGGGVAIGLAPSVGWVALGWGEPLYPWWGPAHFRGHPCWTGWHGAHDSHWDHDDHHDWHGGHGDDHGHDNFQHFKNAGVKDAIVAVDRDHFGRRDDVHGVRGQYWHPKGEQNFQPLDHGPDVTPDASSRVASRGQAERPPQDVRDRTVVATRAPRGERGTSEHADTGRSNWRPWARSNDAGASLADANGGRTTLPTKVVEPKRDVRDHNTAAPRPPFGQSDEVRETPSPPPRFEHAERDGEDSGWHGGDHHGQSNQPDDASWKTRSPVGTPQDDARTGATHRATPPPTPTSSDAQALEQPTDRRHFETSRDRGDTLRSQQSASPPAPREAAPEPARELPGEPANRVYRGQHGGGNRSNGGDAAPPAVQTAPQRAVAPPAAPQAPREAASESPARPQHNEGSGLQSRGGNNANRGQAGTGGRGTWNGQQGGASEH